jgi:predicted nucleotidyltransferase
MSVEHTEADLETVRAFLAKSKQRKAEDLAERLRRAREDCDRIVAEIAKDFHPIRIYQWGSLLDGAHFTEMSDIDIAVEGIIDPAEFFRLLGRVEEMTAFPLDIVQMEHVHPAYAELIRKRGRIVHERGS